MHKNSSCDLFQVSGVGITAGPDVGNISRIAVARAASWLLAAPQTCQLVAK